MFKRGSKVERRIEHCMLKGAGESPGEARQAALYECVYSVLCACWRL